MTGIYNADCLDIMKNLPDNSIDCIVTDCPYLIVQGGCSNNSNYEGRECLSKRRLYTQAGTSAENVRAGKLFTHNDIKFKDWLPECYRVLKENSHCYIMISPRRLKELQIECERVGFIYQNLLVWDKQNSVLNKYYMNSYELILMLRKGGAKNINNLGSRNLISIPIVKNREHPTEKPVSLMEILIENSTNKDDIVLDPFMGSGTTCVAAKKLGRQFIGIEIDEKYYAIAERRLNEINAQMEWRI